MNLNNTGTTPASGILWFEYDSRISSNPIFWNGNDPDYEDGNLLGWEFENLFMGESIRKEVNLEVPRILEVPLGEVFSFKTYFQSDLNAPIEFENLIELDQTCSYDPNDKSVSPISPVYSNDPVDTLFYSLFEEQLDYTIRFENLGNAEAYNVVILDTLDENLNLSLIHI